MTVDDLDTICRYTVVDFTAVQRYLIQFRSEGVNYARTLVCDKISQSVYEQFTIIAKFKFYIVT